MDTFTPPHPPSADQYQDSKTPRLLEADFGDGYMQSAPDGLNAFPSTLDFAWNPILTADASTIESFLTSHVGIAFYFTPPGETTARKWVCTSYTRGKGALWDTVSVTFKERFDLV